MSLDAIQVRTVELYVDKQQGIYFLLLPSSIIYFPFCPKLLSPDSLQGHRCWEEFGGELVVVLLLSNNDTFFCFLQILQVFRSILQSVWWTAWHIEGTSGRCLRKTDDRACHHWGGVGWWQANHWAQASHSQFSLLKSSPKKIIHATYRNQEVGRSSFTSFQTMLQLTKLWSNWPCYLHCSLSYKS